MDTLRQEVPRSRHIWFPIVVFAAAAAWWWRQAAYAQYYTLFHVLVLMLSGLLIGAWFLRFGGAPPRIRRNVVGGLALLLAAFFVAFRPVYNGDLGVYRWQWRFAAAADKSLDSLKPAGMAANWRTTPRDYPRFLGTGYWAEVKGAQLETDWHSHPPQELWRREIGAGWSAFAIAGDYAVTQEQRGKNELVTCYKLQTGEPVWSHADKARFDPADVAGSLGGVGPRATPTIHGDRIYSQGGTGIVNCLDARTGKVIWSHDTTREFGATVTLWGKSGSPLVEGEMVIISVGAPSGAWEGTESAEDPSYNASLVAFDAATGEIRWSAGARQAAYASPVAATLAGERQIVVVNQSWVTAHRARDGKILWEIPWSKETDTDASCSQPVPLEGDRLFLSKGYGVGASLLSIHRESGEKFSVVPQWDPPIKNVMKTKLCNVVVRDGFVYGLDDVLLQCIELETGTVQWKKRRHPAFGHGQIMLIGKVILVQSESGELALVEANPNEYRELARMQALDDANITWNNPAFAPPYLVVRNAREAACYRLPIKE
jgi:outer membrane protein assembly factor BamB